VTEAEVRNVVVEYPSGVRLRLGCLPVEAAARLLRELGGQVVEPAGPALPSVEDLRAYLEAEARMRPVKTSEIHARFLGRRYQSRGPDKATYNAMTYRLARAREAINAGEWECLVAPAPDGSGEDEWFVARRAA
jgi:hypothetical protein